MERKMIYPLKTAVLKRLLLAVAILMVALPAGYRTCLADSVTYRVTVQEGYLALRNAKAYDSSNEIGRLYTGDTVQVQDSSDSTYWYVYSPKLGKSGYVNSDYLY